MITASEQIRKLSHVWILLFVLRRWNSFDFFFISFNFCFQNFPRFVLARITKATKQRSFCVRLNFWYVFKSPSTSHALRALPLEINETALRYIVGVDAAFGWSYVSVSFWNTVWGFLCHFVTAWRAEMERASLMANNRKFSCARPRQKSINHNPVSLNRREAFCWWKYRSPSHSEHRCVIRQSLQIKMTAFGN